MPSLSQVIHTDPIRGFLYGVSGAGKTSVLGLMAQYEEFTPIYWFDWDKRIASLQARLDKKFWDRVIADPYRDNNIPGEAFILMQAKIDKLEKEGIKTAVVDSATFCMKGIMARVLGADGKAATSSPQLQHYMQQISLFEEVVARLCSKQMNIFFTAHEDTQKDEITGRLFKNVDLTGKAANRIPGYFNELWHMEVTASMNAAPTYKIRTRSDAIYSARTTFRTLDTCEDQALIWQKIIKEREGNRNVQAKVS